MRRPLARLAIAALCLGVVLSPAGTATTYVALDPYEVLGRADAVVTAEVDDVRTEARDEFVWTVVSLDVTEWLTDDPGLEDAEDEEDAEEQPRETVTLEFLGGEAEGRRLLVGGAVTWVPGEEVLVAFRQEEGAASPIVGFRQGLWRVRDDALVDADGRYLSLDANGRLVTADRPEPASAVLEAVRSGLDGGEPPAQDETEAQGSAAEDATQDDAPPDAAAAEDGEDVGEVEVAGPAAPTETVRRAYSVEDGGGPLLLSDRLESAASSWESLAPGTIELVASDDAEHRFAYGEEELFGPDLLSLSLVDDGRVEVLIRPEEHPALDAALRHELGALLGLGPSSSGVMAMAVEGGGELPGEAELAELAAIASFVPQDLDRDGVVGFGDLLELAAAYGRSGLNLPADLDGDGDVDDDDVAVLRQAYVFASPEGTDQDGSEESGGADADVEGEPGADEPEADEQGTDDPEDQGSAPEETTDPEADPTEPGAGDSP